jgi:hypothetical protein
MAIACAEANAELIATLRARFGSVVAIRGSPSIICVDGTPASCEGSRFGSRPASPTIFLVTLESPLICEDTPNVEIVIERDGLRFKPWREA